MSDRDCLQCGEPLTKALPPVRINTPEGPRWAHRICMLREVIGGIGHLIAHEYWCSQHGDPDAGLTRFQSAQLVDTYIHAVGIEAAANRGIG